MSAGQPYANRSLLTTRYYNNLGTEHYSKHGLPLRETSDGRVVIKPRTNQQKYIRKEPKRKSRFFFRLPRRRPSSPHNSQGSNLNFSSSSSQSNNNRSVFNSNNNNRNRSSPPTGSQNTSSAIRPNNNNPELINGLIDGVYDPNEYIKKSKSFYKLIHNGVNSNTLVYTTIEELKEMIYIDIDRGFKTIYYPKYFQNNTDISLEELKKIIFDILAEYGKIKINNDHFVYEYMQGEDNLVTFHLLYNIIKGVNNDNLYDETYKSYKLYKQNLNNYEKSDYLKKHSIITSISFSLFATMYNIKTINDKFDILEGKLRQLIINILASGFANIYSNILDSENGEIKFVTLYDKIMKIVERKKVYRITFKYNTDQKENDHLSELVLYLIINSLLILKYNIKTYEELITNIEIIICVFFLQRMHGNLFF